MQVCTQACGKTAPIASGNPVTPSTQAIRTPRTPQVVEYGQPEFRALGLLPPDAEHLALPVAGDPERQIAGAVAHRAVFAHPDPQRVEIDDRIDRIQRPCPPRLDVLQDGVGDAGDRVRADLDPVKLGQVPGDVADGHSTAIERQDLGVQPS